MSVVFIHINVINSKINLSVSYTLTANPLNPFQNDICHGDSEILEEGRVLFTAITDVYAYKTSRNIKKNNFYLSDEALLVPLRTISS